jgi:long-chain acyl-CoA synthetase
MKRGLLSAWEKTVRRLGEARALVHTSDGRDVSFRELDERARAWAQRAASNGHELRGRAVAFAVPNGAAWLEIFLGVLYADAVAVAIDAGEPTAAQRAIAEGVRAGFWWSGGELVSLPRAKRYARPAGVIKVTSGSTGRPKALVFSDEQIVADARVVTSTMGITARDVNYAMIPFGHSYGIGNLVGPLITLGVPIVVGASVLPHAIAEDFAKWQPTVLPSVPAVWRALASADVSLRSLRLGISAGAPLPAEVAQEFQRRQGKLIHNFYGSSETGGIAFDRSGKATLAGGVGTAMRGVTLRVQRGQRLCVSGPAVITQGNRRRDGKLGAYVMPDRAAVDAQGHVSLLGRRGRVVKIAGRRVNLEEIAARLRRVSGVSEVWVGVSAEGVLGAALAGTTTSAAVRSALHGDTAAWKIPKRVVVMATLPLTERGKVDGRAIHAAVFGGGRR